MRAMGLPGAAPSGAVRTAYYAPLKCSKGVVQNRRASTPLRVVNVATNSTLTPPTPVKELPLPDGPLSSYVPVIGETLELGEKGPVNFWLERSPTYGPIFRVHYLGKACYMVGDYASIERALMADQKLTRVTFPDAFKEVIGTDGFMTDKNLHQILRRQVGQAFGPKAMHNYSKVLPGIINPYVDKAAAAGSFDAYKLITNITVDFSMQLVCGLPLEDPAAKEIIRTMTPLLIPGGVSPLPKVNLPGFPFYEAMRAREKLVEVLRELLIPRKAQILEHAYAPSNDCNFLTQMLQAKVQEGVDDIDNDDVLINTTLNVLMASFDNSKSNLVVLLAILAMAPPHIVEALRAEQRSVVEKHGEAFTGAALTDMTYTNAFIKEAMRTFSGNPMLTRLVLEDFELHGKRVPAGCTLLLNFAAASLDEDVIPENERGVMYAELSRSKLEKTLRPERWLGESSKWPIHSAFGIGPHFCLGAPLYIVEAKAFLATLLRGYDLTYEGPDTIEFDRTILAVPKEPLFLKIAPLAAT